MKKQFIILIILGSLLASTGMAQNPKRLLVDDLTSTWCGHCVCMDSMLHKVILPQYPGTIILAYHGMNSAYFRTKPYSLVPPLAFGEAPCAIPDRRSPTLHVQEMHDSIVAMYARIPEASVKIDLLNRIWNPATRTVSFTVSATAIDTNMTGLFRINVMIIESNLISLQWISEECGPNKEDTAYNHMNVVRDVFYPWQGDSLIGPVWPQNQTIERNYNMILDSVVVPGNCEFVVYVDKMGPKPDSLYLCPIQQANKQPVTGTLGQDDQPGPATAILTVYPNPARNQINIHLRIKDEASSKIMIFNASGEKVKQIAPQHLKQGTYNLELSTAGLPPGNYTIVLYNGDSKVSKKIIIY